MKNVVGFLVASFLLVATRAQGSPADGGVLSCSGYVQSAFPIDFSKVEVALFTEHGSKRDSTDCAPSSGYFFLPVEEHQAKYSLKVRVLVRYRPSCLHSCSLSSPPPPSRRF